MRRQQTVLIGLCRPAHRFQRAEVGRDEAQAGHPGGDLAAGHEEILARVGELLQIEADPQHDHEIDPDDEPIHRASDNNCSGMAPAAKRNTLGMGIMASKDEDGRHECSGFSKFPWDLAEFEIAGG